MLPPRVCVFAGSLPLMRKTFIEAAEPPKPAGKGSSVSSAYAEDFH